MREAEVQAWRSLLAPHHMGWVAGALVAFVGTEIVLAVANLAVEV